MARRLPSLNGLKAFEAAARAESFSDAAAELFVTHAAISRHIRELEEYLGTDLFTRTGRGVALTDAGRRFGQRLTPLFDEVAAASLEAAAAGQARSLKVSVQSTIASRWLVYRLGAFNAMHPDIELTVDNSNELVNFYADDVDLGMRYGRGGWADVEETRLCEVTFFPVCSPAFLAKHPGLVPADLSGTALLHEDQKRWWDDWLRFAGVKNPDASKGPLFQNQLALEAAEGGQGFALADAILATDALINGWLVKPFTPEISYHSGYWLVRKKGQRETGPMRAFREWVSVEAAETLRKFQAFKQQGLKPA